MTFEQLLRERRDFEIYIYDLLVEIPIPDDFWEPIEVFLTIEQIRSLEDFIGESECTICLENHLNFKRTCCCKHILCNGCANNWFSHSVKCPYCNDDQRKYI